MYVYSKIKTQRKNAKCRFFVVPADSPALLGIPDLELLGILKVTCEVIRDQQSDRKFNSQDRKFNSKIIKLSNSSSCKASTDQWIKTDNADVVDTKTSMPVYFRSGINRPADKRAGQVLMQKKYTMHSVIL